MEESNSKNEIVSDLSEEVFLHETSMCRKSNRKKGGRCNWGECRNCGVIPLLIKLRKNKLLEKPEEIDEAKRNIFNS